MLSPPDDGGIWQPVFSPAVRIFFVFNGGYFTSELLAVV